MAKYFRISAREKSRGCLSLMVSGVFDASSACELIHRLDQIPAETARIAIDTDGLTTINTFGLDVFIPRMNRLNDRRRTITIIGRFSDLFKER